MSLSSFCVVHLLLGMKPALNSGLYAQWDSLEVVFKVNICVRDRRGTVSTPPLSTRTLSGPVLCIFYACYHGLCVLLCFYDLVGPIPFFYLLFHRVPWGLRRVICGRNPSFFIEIMFSIQWTQSIKLTCICVHLIMSIKWNSIIALNFH